METFTRDEYKQIAGTEFKACSWAKMSLFDDAFIICMSPDVTVRRGCRCANGCYGEGIFAYVCEDHIDVLGVNWDERISEGDSKCARCDEVNVLEVFPLQRL